jgi:phosphate transport system substrate-binding protein
MPRFNMKVAAVVIPAALLLAACGGSDDSATPAETTSAPAATSTLSGEIRIDGSSTVAPLSAAAGELFKAENPDVNVSVGTSGTGGGFAKFCAGETDISNASRPIKDEEAETCAAAGIEFTRIDVANDALTVVVSKENDWATCLTVEELNKIWAPEAEGKITNWSQVRAGFPDVKLDLHAPGTDSGTFDYFTEVINGDGGASRTDFSPSEDDNIIVQGVQGSAGGMGYFGLSYFNENSDKLTAVEIDGGAGCVASTSENAQAGIYVPLARPLFIYANNASAQKPEVISFLDFYVVEGDAIANKALFIPLGADQKTAAASAVAGLK